MNGPRSPSSTYIQCCVGCHNEPLAAGGGHSQNKRLHGPMKTRPRMMDATKQELMVFSPRTFIRHLVVPVGYERAVGCYSSAVYPTKMKVFVGC